MSKGSCEYLSPQTIQIENISIQPTYFLARFRGISPDVGLPNLVMSMEYDERATHDVIFDCSMKISAFSSISTKEVPAFLPFSNNIWQANLGMEILVLKISICLSKNIIFGDSQQLVQRGQHPNYYSRLNASSYSKYACDDLSVHALWTSG